MADDIFTRIRDVAPVDRSYVFGRYHRDRISIEGYWTEAKVFGASLLKARNRDVSKFLIIARARSGTTLLTQLLDSHPDVTCDREIFAKKVLFPTGYFHRLAGKSSGRAYGAKLLSYQMVLVQNFHAPRAFLESLLADGVTLVHLRRDTFAQTVSLTRAQQSSQYHIRASETAAARQAQAIDPQEFLRRLRWNAALMEYEVACLRNLPHLALSYEADLTTPEMQANAAARVFEAIGVPPVAPSSDLRKALPDDPRRALENYAEIRRHVVAEGLGHLLPDQRDEVAD
jgi:LPS sulfotransferase NodH